MNLYIFNETRPAAVFGVGTYIRELTNVLRNSNINVCVLNLWSEKHQITIEIKEGIKYWNFPSPIPEERTINYKKQRKLYFRNIVYLLRLLISDKNDLIFHLNYMNSKPLAEALRATFECKLVLVVHHLDSTMTLFGNIGQLRRIIAQNDEGTNRVEKSAKLLFQEEREMLLSADKIICLSNNTLHLLHHDYRIGKEKIVVICNGIGEI